MSIARVVLLSAALAALPLTAQTMKVAITSPGTYYSPLGAAELAELRAAAPNVNLVPYDKERLMTEITDADGAIGVITPVWESWWAGALSLLVWSVFYTMVTINSISYRQQVTPEPLLSRVNTAGRMLSWGLGWTGGAFLAGILSGWLGLQATLFAVTAVPFVGVLVAWTSPLVRARQLPVD